MYMELQINIINDYVNFTFIRNNEFLNRFDKKLTFEQTLEASNTILLKIYGEKTKYCHKYYLAICNDLKLNSFIANATKIEYIKYLNTLVNDYKKYAIDLHVISYLIPYNKYFNKINKDSASLLFLNIILNELDTFGISEIKWTEYVKILEVYNVNILYLLNYYKNKVSSTLKDLKNMNILHHIFLTNNISDTDVINTYNEVANKNIVLSKEKDIIGYIPLDYYYMKNSIGIYFVLDCQNMVKNMVYYGFLGNLSNNDELQQQIIKSKFGINLKNAGNCAIYKGAYKSFRRGGFGDCRVAIFLAKDMLFKIVKEILAFGITCKNMIYIGNNHIILESCSHTDSDNVINKKIDKFINLISNWMKGDLLIGESMIVIKWPININKENGCVFTSNKEIEDSISTYVQKVYT
jgi:hypothetical protein